MKLHVTEAFNLPRKHLKVLPYSLLKTYIHVFLKLMSMVPLQKLRDRNSLIRALKHYRYACYAQALFITQDIASQSMNNSKKPVKNHLSGLVWSDLLLAVSFTYGVDTETPYLTVTLIRWDGFTNIKHF